MKMRKKISTKIKQKSFAEKKSIQGIWPLKLLFQIIKDVLEHPSLGVTWQLQHDHPWTLPLGLYAFHQFYAP